MPNRLNSLLENSIKRHWNLPALCNYQGEPYTFGEVAREIARYHKTWREAGLQPGFRIALYSRNCAEWNIALLAAFTYRAVAVPLLNEFTQDMVDRLVEHSEAKILLTAKDLVRHDDCPEITADDVKYELHAPEELLMINYTSGTTSAPKGVMIPERAMWSNMDFAQNVLPFLKAGMKVLSLLPTAHLYGMAFELMYEFVAGIQIVSLNRPLSPNLILSALKEVKPSIVVVVPMLIEKVVRKGIMPQFNDPKIRAARAIPFVRQIINRKFREGLQAALGGNFYEVIIGGAGLNSEVEDVLREIGFNYTVGYGMTECSPIICYADWKEFVRNSCGKAALHMEVRIDSKDPQNIPGEILTRGINVMLGYYKNEEATRAAIDEDGWLHTGDMGIMDSVGNVFIKGRLKTMLLSSSGQNIYPEEIEAAVNGIKYVNECVVVQREHRLVALVYPDRESCAKAGIATDEDILKFLESQRASVNKKFPVYSQVNAFELVETEFEKTPKKSIKRFLYS